MNRLTMLLAVTMSFAQAGICLGQLGSATVRYEFDGDEVPSEFIPGFTGGTQSVEDGSLILHPFDIGAVSSTVPYGHADFVAETRIRFLEPQAREDFASLNIRDFAQGDGQSEGYTAAVSTEGNLLLARLTPGNPNDLIDPVIRATASGFDAVSEDIVLRVVAVDANIDLYAWPASGEAPAVPTLSLFDDEPFLDNAFVALANTSYEVGAPAALAAFRYLDLSPVPEPGSLRLALLGTVGIAAMRRRR